MAAQRLVLGDAVHELGVLGDGMLRLDANSLLGIERDPNGKVWWADHPLSRTANELIASMVRKLGGFTFEENASPFDVLREQWRGGPDLSYDFVTRPAYDHALLTGDAGFLRLIFQIMRHDDIDPGRLIHALQNHDELTMGLGHFVAHADETFQLNGMPIKGGELRAQVHREMYDRLIGEHAPYNLKFGDGVASTKTTVAAAALGIRNISKLQRAQVEKIKKLHLLLAFYNAMQPGVFALSGWDLVGALTLPAATVHERLADGDTRWINRGAYDLIGSNPHAKSSAAGLPRAVALYGPLPEQLKDPGSFAASLARLLKARSELHLYAAHLADVPAVKAKGLLVLVNELPGGAGTEVTAINFGAQVVDETVPVIGAAQGARVSDVMDPGAQGGSVGADGAVQLHLGAYEYKALRITR
jgi:trehalose synthase